MSLEAIWTHFRTFGWRVQAVALGLIIGTVIVVLAPAP